MKISHMAGLTVALATLGIAVPAFAHAHLTSAMPPMDASVQTAPTELDLTFSEGLTLRFTGVTLLAPDSKAVPTGPASLKAGGDKVPIVPIPARLGAGLYRVEWHALSTDGHKTQGRYTFTMKP